MDGRLVAAAAAVFELLLYMCIAGHCRWQLLRAVDCCSVFAVERDGACARREVTGEIDAIQHQTGARVVVYGMRCISCVQQPAPCPE